MPAEAGGYVLAAEGSKVLAVTGAGGWTGIAGRCSHRGGPLDEGTIRNGCVECPWHHSVFRLDDGSVVTGPATAPQPTYDVKADAGSYWFRRRSAKVAPPA